MENWLTRAVRGVSVPPQQEGLPEWLDNVLDIKRILMEFRVRLMEDSIPRVLKFEPYSRETEYPAPTLTQHLHDIIDKGNWKIMKEAFILLHREGLSFPAILLPDLLDTPARDRKYIENIIYLAPVWARSWLEGHQKDQTFPEKAMDRWQRLLLMPDGSEEKLSPQQLLFLVRHSIFNEKSPSEELLKKAWARLNTDKRATLIDLLPNDENTESFLWPRIKTRSATLKHHITLKLMKVRGAFYEVIRQLTQTIPKAALSDPDAWPNNVKEGLRTSLHLDDDDDVDAVIFNLKWEDLFDMSTLPPESFMSGLPEHLRSSMVSGALLHENIRDLIDLVEKDRQAIIDISIREMKMLSTAAYCQLLDQALFARWCSSRDKIDLILLKESYFPGQLSLKIVKWLRHDIIDKKPFLAEDIIDALSYRADPRVYPELLAMNEQSIYYPSDVVKPLRRCIQTMQQRMAFRNELQKLKRV